MEIGSIYQNVDGRKCVIIEKDVNRCTNKHTFYVVRFIESGYTVSVRSDVIRSGLFRDYLDKTIFGIACMGYASTRQAPQEYRVWYNMLSRCYNKSDRSYRFYGARDVRVDQRWHRFDIFLNDVPNICGYDQDLFKQRKLRLDKDFRSGDNKIYSLETTMWVSDLMNQKIRTYQYNMKARKYVIFPDGHTELIRNLTDFCKQHDLHYQNVILCLSGKQRASKGYKFYTEKKSTDYPSGGIETQQE